MKSTRSRSKKLETLQIAKVRINWLLITGHTRFDTEAGPMQLDKVTFADNVKTSFPRRREPMLS
jgi:hypothetical protein